MRILVINPNTTVAMTEQIGRAARAAAASGTAIIAVNPMDGPVSIEHYYQAGDFPGVSRRVLSGSDEHHPWCEDGRPQSRARRRNDWQRTTTVQGRAG